MYGNRSLCKNVTCEILFFFFFFDKCVRWPSRWPRGMKCATLSSSYRTFKLDYIYFSAEWLEKDRSGFYYGEPVLYVSYDGYVECGQVSRKYIKEDGRYPFSFSTCVYANAHRTMAALQIGPGTGKKMLRASRYTFESWSTSTARGAMFHVL